MTESNPNRTGGLGRLVRLRRTALLLALVATVAAPVPGWAQEPADDETPRIEVSLEEAIEMALRNNLQVQIASYTPDVQEEAIMASRARFDPTLTFNLPSTYNRSVSQGTTTLAGADVLTRENIAGGFSFAQTLEWGTNWSLSWTSSRAASNNSFSSFNPQYTAGLGLSVTQPLLQGFGREVNTSQIISARNSFESSLEQFRASVQNIAFQTYQAYWELVFAMNNLEVQQAGLDLAIQQLDRNRIQVEIGTLAPIETIQAEQDVASRQLSVTQQQVAVRDRMDDLKRLMNVEMATPYGWNVEVVPTDDAPTSVDPIDVGEAIRVAMENDPELEQQRIQLRNRNLSVKTARNALLPELSFTGSIDLSGNGGDRIFTQGFGSDAILEVQEGGFSDALQSVFSGDFRNWSVGLTLRFPINNWADRAQHAQAVIQERTTLAQIADLEQQLRVEVMQAARNVDSLVAQVAQAQTASELAARQLDAEQRKFAVGSTTNFEVLTFQRRLSDSQTQELRATINLANAIARLELAKGTLLESLGFRIGMAGVPAGPGSR